MRISDWSSDVCSSDLAADGEYDVDELRGVERGGQALPGRGTDAGIGVQFIDGVQQIGIERCPAGCIRSDLDAFDLDVAQARSEAHTSELQSLMRISYAVLCFKNKNPQKPQSKT